MRREGGRFFFLPRLCCRACKCTDPETGELRRFGFVDFADYGVVRKVMNITKHYIKVSQSVSHCSDQRETNYFISGEKN